MTLLGCSMTSCVRRTLGLGSLLMSAALGACAGPASGGDDSVGASAQSLSVADCPSGYAVLVGTSASDVLNGTAGNDCIVGLGGSDTIHGLGGNDFLIGGGGNDRLYGDDGNDQLFGETGEDTLDGGNHDDTITGEGSKDTISGGAGNDTIDGGAIGDVISGGDGDDTLRGGAGNDVIDGNAGADVIYGGDADDTIHGNDGADRIFGDGGIDQLYGDAHDDVIDGGAHADTIRGGDGDDVIDGDLANDTLFGEAGEDVLIGGAGTNTSNGGPGTDACSGTACELPAMTPTGCTQDAQCSAGKRCIVDIGLCLGCLADQDSDGVCNSADGCPADASKSAPGICGCGVSDADSDSDGTANCNDGCPSDAAKTAAGICGCGVSDADSDSDGTANCNDGCPADASKTAAGICGCGVSDADSDNDGTANCNDGCPSDAAKIAAGICGCGVSDADSDNDGTANCNDACPADAAKVAPGACGCDASDADSDNDGAPDCQDSCAGHPDQNDGDGDGIPDGCDPELTCTSNASGPLIFQGDAVIDSAGDLAALAGKPCISGDLIVELSSLTDLTGLENLVAIAGALRIASNDSLASLDGLQNLVTVGRGIVIEGNAELASLAALAELTSASVSIPEATWALLVRNNESLSGCWSWLLAAQVDTECGAQGSTGPFIPCSGNRGTSSCGELPPGFVCTATASGPGVYDGYLSFGYFEQDGELADFGGLVCVTGDLTVYGSEATDLSELSSLTGVAGRLDIGGNPQLGSLAGLENLRAVGQGLLIHANPQLSNLAGLANLTSVDATLPAGWSPLQIVDNENLPPCWTWLLEEQTNRQCSYQWGGPAQSCSGNHGTGSCGELPPDFECTASASGPGVFHGDLFLDPYSNPGGPIDISDYSGLTCVTGSLTIGYSQLTDLQALSSLVGVGGSLGIMNNSELLSLAGLENLRTVGQGLWIDGNPLITSLAPLANLTSIDALMPEPAWNPLMINNNAALTACWTWLLEEQTNTQCGHQPTWGGPFVRCGDNRGTGSCGALPPDFECTADATGPGVFHGSLASSFDPFAEPLDLSEYGGLRCVTGNLSIDNTFLTDLQPLTGIVGVAGSVNIFGNSGLTSLAGLEDLRTIGQGLYMGNNDQLNSLAALSNLEQVAAAPSSSSSLVIDDNDSLPACWTWLLAEQTSTQCGYQPTWGGPFQPCDANRGQGSCGALPPDFECTSMATGPGVFHGNLPADPYMLGNPLDLSEYGGLACITGNLNISYSELTDLQALSGLVGVGGSVSIFSNDALTSLAGLENLRTIGQGLFMENNAQLGSLAALANLEQVAAAPSSWSSLLIEDNDSLPACWTWLLEEQTGTLCGYQPSWGGQFDRCGRNRGQGSCGALPVDFQCTPTATGPGVYHGDLETDPVGIGGQPLDFGEYGGLACVTGNLEISGTELTDLQALSGLVGVGGTLSIFDNDQLTSLAGLESLATVGQGLLMEENDQLASLAALASLVDVDLVAPSSWSSLMIDGHDSLPACWAWLLEERTGTQCGYQPSWGPFHSCGGNRGSGSCGALPVDFECTPTATGPGVFHGNLETDPNPLGGQPIDLGEYGGVTCVTGNLWIDGSDLVDLQPLSTLVGVAGNVNIFGNDALTSLAGLENLTTIGQGLYIENNDQLATLAALVNLTDVELVAPSSWSSLVIDNNASLPGCWAWLIEQQTETQCGYYSWMGPFQPCHGNVGIGSCGALPPGFACVTGASGPGVYDGDLAVGGLGMNPFTLADLGGLACVTGDLRITNTSGMMDLAPLANLVAVGDELELGQNADLLTVHGLESLTAIGSSLTIHSNGQLSTLEGLSALSSIGLHNPNGLTELSVFYNAALPSCWVGVLETQTAESCTNCTENNGAGTCE